MKRLVVLLIALAGGLAAAAFAVPSNTATVNGVAISQQQLNSDLNAIGKSSDYQCFLNAQQLVDSGGQSTLPPIEGVGTPTGTDSHPTVTASFASTYLDTLIGHQLVLALVAHKHLEVTPAALDSARTQFVAQMTAVLSDVASTQYRCLDGGQSATAGAVMATMPSSFIARTVQFDAAVTVLEENEAGVGSSPADLQRYYGAHASDFDTACFTVAQYTTQAAAQAAAASVTAGTPFAQVATQAGGGPQTPCSILYGIASQLPAGTNLQNLPVGAVSNPIAENGSYLLVQITQRTPTPFSKAESEVQAAVQNAGATKARTDVNAVERKASVSVNGRYGQWTPSRALIVPPVSPLGGDVLNAAANSTAVKTATKTPQSTTAPAGQSS